MSDKDENYRSMAIATRDELKSDRTQWEPTYAKLATDYTALEEALTGLDELIGPAGSHGATTARMRAEQAALDAAVPVLRGMRAAQLDHPDASLAELSKLTRSDLDDLRDTLQVNRLRDLHKAATDNLPQLQEERVTADHLLKLHNATDLLAGLVGSPRKQIIADSQITDSEADWMKKVRAAIKRLDVRVPNLESDLPEVVGRYRRARKLIKLGGRSKKKEKGTE